MADKNFGVKQINIIGGSGTPTITSPNVINLNAPTVAISTDLSVGGSIVSDIIVGSGYSVGIGTTNPTSALTVQGDISGSGNVSIGNTLYFNKGNSSGIFFGTPPFDSGQDSQIWVSDTLYPNSFIFSNIDYGARFITSEVSLNSGSLQFVGLGTTAAHFGGADEPNYKVGIRTTNPTSALTVGAVGSATTSLTVNGYTSINGANVITWPNATDTRQSIYIGQGSGSTLAGGYYNVALGTRALEECGLGDNSNIAIGYEALRYGGGDANVVIGTNAVDSSSFSGNCNVVIGKDAGTAMTSAFSNTLIGYAAGDSITTGDNNIFIGRDSGASITTGNRNVIIGEYDGTGAVSDDPAYPGYYEGSLNLADSTANIVIADGYGTVKMYINPEGNVGIATTNPTSKLTVKGNTSLETLSVSGVSTLSNVVVGGGTTELIVNGDARITGILTIGTASITIDPSTNTITTNNIIVTNGSSQPYYAEPHSVNDGLPIEIVVGVTSTKQTTHRFFGTGGGYSYLLDSQESPYLNLIVGKTYWFAQEDGSNALRPIKFFTDISHNTEYTDGVSTSDGISVGNPGFYTQLIVTETTPSILYYDNETITPEIDGYMGNQINIIGSNKIGTGTTTYFGNIVCTGINTSTFSNDVRVGVDTSSGLIITSPNGTQYRLIVDDSGNLSTMTV